MTQDGREGGAIWLHRRVMSSAVWNLPLAQYRVWETVLLLANWKPTTIMVRGQAITIPRGSCLVAERTLADYGGVTRKVVSKALAALERIEMVSFTKIGPGAKGGPTVRIINILNYERYQSPQEDERGQPGGQPGGRSEEGKKGRRKEASPEPVAPGPGSVVVLPCVGNGQHGYGVTQAQVEGWGKAYPGVNVRSELERMRVWLEANPSKRKTHRGIPAFIVRWLGRSQDRGGGRAPPAPSPVVPLFR